MSYEFVPNTVVEPRRTGPAWNTAAAAVVAVLVIAYIVAAIVQIVMLNEATSDMTALGNAMSGADPLSDVRALETTIASHIATMHRADQMYQISFWAMFIAFFGWNAILRSKLRALGRGFDRRSITAWKVWRVGMLVSIVMIFVAQSGSATDTPEAAISKFHELMAYYGVRAAVGALYLWVVYSVWRSAGPEFAAGPRTAPYAPGFPPSPTTYYPSNDPLPVVYDQPASADPR